jgi:hypothetical protein
LASPLRYEDAGPVGGANSLSPRGPVGGDSLRRGGERSRSRLKSRDLSLSRSRNGDLATGTVSLTILSSTRAALLGWIGGGEDRREVAADSRPEGSLEANRGFEGEGDLRLLQVSAGKGSARSRLGEGERRRKSRVSRAGGEYLRGGLGLLGLAGIKVMILTYLLTLDRGSSYRATRTGERTPRLLAGEASRSLGSGDLSRGRGERVYES